MKRFVSVLLMMCLMVAVVGCKEREIPDSIAETSEKIVEDIPAAYKEILAGIDITLDKMERGNYTVGVDGPWGVADYLWGMGYDEYRSKLGYQVIDINGDGVDELIIALPLDDKDEYRILNVYTLDGDEAIQVAETYPHSDWYINSEGLFINVKLGTVPYYTATVYRFDDNSSNLTEVYSLHNEYIEDTREVAVYESVNCGEETMLYITDDPYGTDEVFEYYMDVVDEYAANVYEFDLVSVFP